MHPLRLVPLALARLAAPLLAQPILFTFDDARIHAPLPIDLTAGGVNAHLWADSSVYNYSVQFANVLGFTPVGFSGFCIYPNQVFKCDLDATFSVPLTAFSILYSVQELDCDSSATMRVTAYMNDVYVGTATKVAQPGVWPTATLAITTAEPFNKVVVHYDSPPPTGGDWGPIFMADNMWITPAPDPCADADYNADGAVNTLDVLGFLNAWTTHNANADCDGNGLVDTRDVSCFLNTWAGCR
ncbi:MAG: hypothetical protein IPJ41_09925 [Phycisphaerales bacterium]|nr:hypothetical protein [Phycisphaerales bacterium]